LKTIETEQVDFQIISLFIKLVMGNLLECNWFVIDLIFMDFIHPRKYLVTRMAFLLLFNIAASDENIYKVLI